MKGARLSLIAAMLLAATSGCDVCGLIEQQIIVPADDPDLSALIVDCQGAMAGAAVHICAQPTGAGVGRDTPCACSPLCERVFAIVAPGPSRPPLQECRLRVDDAGLAHVTIEYRSVCQ